MAFLDDRDLDKIVGLVPSNNPPMHDEGWIADELSEKQRQSLWWSGFDAMCRVHKLDWQGLGLEFLLQPERGETPLDQQLHYYEQYFTWAGDRSRYPITQRVLQEI